MPKPAWLALTLLCFVFLTSCESANRLLKAKPADLSAFVEHPKEMEPRKDRVPFHRIWISRNREVNRRAAAKTEIYFAPVTLQYLRPISKTVARNEVADGTIQRREGEVADRVRFEFMRAFAESTQPRYYLAKHPGTHSLTVEIALVELNPTSPAGNAYKTTAGFFIGFFASPLGYFTKGNIAIEGKVRNSQTHELVFEFADNQADLMTFYSARDFKPYGHAVHAIEAWATQFEEFTRTPAEHKVEETNFFTLSPW